MSTIWKVASKGWTLNGNRSQNWLYYFSSTECSNPNHWLCASCYYKWILSSKPRWMPCWIFHHLIREFTSHILTMTPILSSVINSKRWSMCCYQQENHNLNYKEQYALCWSPTDWKFQRLFGSLKSFVADENKK